MKSTGAISHPQAGATLSGEDLILTWKITFLFTAHWTLLHSGSGAQEGVECRGMWAQDIKGTLGDCST